MNQPPGASGTLSSGLEGGSGLLCIKGRKVHLFWGTGPGEQTLHGPQHLPGSLAGPSRVHKHRTAALRLSDRDAFAHRAVPTEHSGRCPETPGQVSGLSRPVPGSLGWPRRAVSGRCPGPGPAALKPPEGGHQERPWEHPLPSLRLHYRGHGLGPPLCAAENGSLGSCASSSFLFCEVYKLSRNSDCVP